MSARAIALLLLVASPAPADSSVPQKRPGAPSASDREAARRLFTEGVHLYDDGKFGEAAAKLERAMAFADEPAVLFNIAQARRMNGERKAALAAYRAFLTRKPDPPQRKAVEQLIADLETPDAGAR
ncbi:MAG TPA: hypothetical protein VFF06_30300 [Polyangia bacterium]|nr:hypothetical protein [Polyangia bacterium]